MSGNTESNWIGVMIPLTDFLTGRTRHVPGWKCKTCGSEYGCIQPPSKCWKCNPDSTTQPLFPPRSK